MTVKMRYKQATEELELTEGEFDSSTSLATSLKGKLLQSNGNFEGRDFDEGDDILEGATQLPNSGNFGGYFDRYTQANFSVSTQRGTGRNGNNYAYVMRRAPDISSASTWGGVRLRPPSTLQRVQDNKFRVSFDYRGYSGGFTMNIYPAREIGWTTLGVNLTIPYSPPDIAAFDTDWEWRHYSTEFTVTSQYLNYVAGAYDWNSTTQYPGGDYGIRYNGDLYRHRLALALPTLGVDPETEYQQGGVYDAKWVGGAAPGFFNLYEQFKIGFTYQTQNARGTHVHVDNITITNINTNESFKYNLGTDTWESENISEGTLQLLAKGTAYVAQARSDDGTDVFAVEGSRQLFINGTSYGVATGRGLTLTIMNQAGTVSFNQVYDVYGVPAKRDELATKLATLVDADIWVLTSFDAVGTEGYFNSNPNLRNQLISMGSSMWNPNEPNYLWAVDVNQVRNPYAAVGRGQNLLKEDGSNAADTVFKRKGVVDVRL